MSTKVSKVLRHWLRTSRRWIGRRVYLKDRSKPATLHRATIQHVYGDVAGGVILDRYIDGFRSWNMDDLRLSNGAKLKWKEKAK